MTTRVREISIAKVISDHLILRDSAAAFFDDVEQMQEEAVVVDFDGVIWMSRAFAHEYLTRKRLSKKTVGERNIPEDVQKMMSVVAKPSPKKKLFGDDIEVITTTRRYP